jgi:hypothetical protein
MTMRLPWHPARGRCRSGRGPRERADSDPRQPDRSEREPGDLPNLLSGRWEPEAERLAPQGALSLPCPTWWWMGRASGAHLGDVKLFNAVGAIDAVFNVDG